MSSFYFTQQRANVLTNLTINGKKKKKKIEISKRIPSETSASKQHTEDTPAAELRTGSLNHIWDSECPNQGQTTQTEQWRSKTGTGYQSIILLSSQNKKKDSGCSRVSNEGGKKPSDFFFFGWQQTNTDRRLSRPVWDDD